MICMNCSWKINQVFLQKNIFYSFKAKKSEAFKSKIVVSFDFQNQKWKMEYEWYAWIQKLTIKEKRRVPSCLGWDLQNSWNCWDQKYLLIVLGRKNDWPPAYFLFIVGISLHGGFSCTRFTREHKQKREVALYSCCASQKPLNYWYQEIK